MTFVLENWGTSCPSTWKRVPTWSTPKSVSLTYRFLNLKDMLCGYVWDPPRWNSDQHTTHIHHITQNKWWCPLFIILSTPLLVGVMHTNVGHQVMLITLSRGFFTKFYIRWSCDVTSPPRTTQTTNKHQYHGDGAAPPSSGVDSMRPHRPSGRQTCACSVRDRCRTVLIES